MHGSCSWHSLDGTQKLVLHTFGPKLVGPLTSDAGINLEMC